MSHYKKVREFMQKAGQEVPSEVRVPSFETRVLRARLILEEALETIEAMGLDTNIPDEVQFGNSRIINTWGVLDGCGDIRVVTTGTLIAFGFDEGAFDEAQSLIDDSNLRKFGPGGHRREDGKWIKPPDWVAPDFSHLLP